MERIIVDRIGRYLADKIRLDLESMEEHERSRAAIWEEFSVNLARRALEMAKHQKPLIGEE